MKKIKGSKRPKIKAGPPSSSIGQNDPMGCSGGNFHQIYDVGPQNKTKVQQEHQEVNSRRHPRIEFGPPDCACASAQPDTPLYTNRALSDLKTSAMALPSRSAHSVEMRAVGSMFWVGAVVVSGAVVGGRLCWAWAVAACVVGMVVCRRKLVILWKTFGRDVRYLQLLRKTYAFLRECEKKDRTILDLFRGQVKKNSEKPIFYFEEQIWTFSDMDAFSNRVANAFQAEGYRKGDVFALIMPNCPEYVGLWLGLAKIGAVTALINTNLRNQSLLHCLNAAKATAIIYSEEFDAAVAEISADVGPLKKYRWGTTGPKEEAANLNQLMETAPASPPVRKDAIGYRDRVLYVYTSGTTGLPKAAIIPHHRLLMMSMGVCCVMGVRESDIIYNPLPLFHTAGGVVGTMGPLCHGCSSLIRRKFSATAFWPDCVKYSCTVAQYIGEMCRYILMVPPRPEDTLHKVRFVFGNGMRSTLWTEFRERFRLQRISEIYGSTEGNINLVNLNETVGAVGFLPRILPESLIPTALIKVNEFGEPIRNSKGLCIRCAENEPGMFIGMIESSDATREYSGYVGDKSESEKKVVKDVFRKGDRAFLSGDLLMMDELGYLYFKDRTGDTFKWKGENVSTAEVEGILSAAAGLRDVLVYGVQVGNLEGRAGMATIVDPDSKVDLHALTAEMDRNLPPYARPLFLRFTDHVDLTGTYKLKKLNFQKEGFDPEKIRDRLYFRQGNGGYVELTKEMYEDIISGAVRV